jgi:MFS family permease
MKPDRGGTYRFYVLGLLTVVGVCSWVDRQIFSILMEDIRKELGLNDTQLGLLGGVAFGLFYATVGLPVAWLADRFSRRNIIAVALTMWSGMTALCGLATGFGTLFLGRVGVGIGEAGGSPPSQSLISDYFAPEERGFALGIFHLYLPLGFMAGFLLGGWINELFGWREAFLVVGLPGLLLAGLLRLTLREPARGAMDRRPPSGGGETTSLWATVRHFLGRGALRYVPLAGAVHGIGAWGVAVWAPSYFMRVHGMGSGEVGTWLAAVFGIGGAGGVVLGGRLADHLARRHGDARWYLWMSAAVVLSAVPFGSAVFLTSVREVALGAFFVSIFFGHMFLGPVMAMIQALAGPRRRAQGAAYYLFLANLVSMGLGPLIVGASSDLFQARFGTGGMRYAMLILFAVTSLVSCALFLRGAKTLRGDLVAAESM